MSAVGEPLSLEEERALHARLVAGDPTATADVLRDFLDYLVRGLVKKNSRRVPEELCVEAAEDALLGFVKSPGSYKPELGKRLASYLRMSAQGDLKNILRRESRHWRRKSLEDVELSPDAGKYLTVHDDPSLRLVHQEDSARATTTVVAPARDGLTPAEALALDLILQGERKTAAFAEVLGIAHLSTSDQRAEVKRVKDKLKVRIKRNKGNNAKPS
jgi:RNA polymerase sigma-70 factor (ECF subfamily)